MVIDAKKVINGLRSIKTYLASQAIETTDDFAREGFIESQKDIDDALFLLKEQEHKDRMFHALEDDWKRLKELLKEHEAVDPRVSTAEQRCGHCNKVIEMDGWKACPWCGKRINWESWWKKNEHRQA